MIHLSKASCIVNLRSRLRTDSTIKYCDVASEFSSNLGLNAWQKLLQKLQIENRTQIGIELKQIINCLVSDRTQRTDKMW